MTARKTAAVSLQEASRLLGRHRSTLTAWLAKGCPSISAAKRETGVEWRLDLGEVLDWYAAQAVAEVRAKHERELSALRLQLRDLKGEGADVPIEEARRRKLAAEARLAEIEVGLRDGKLVDFTFAMEFVGLLLTGVRGLLLGLPAKLGGQIPSNHGRVDATVVEVVEMLRNHLHEAMHQISDGTFEVPLQNALRPQGEAGAPDA